MTSPAIRTHQSKQRGEQQNAMQHSAPHYAPTSPVEAHADALAVKILMADRFVLNIILE